MRTMMISMANDITTYKTTAAADVVFMSAAAINTQGIPPKYVNSKNNTLTQADLENSQVCM